MGLSGSPSMWTTAGLTFALVAESVDDDAAADRAVRADAACLGGARDLELAWRSGRLQV